MSSAAAPLRIAMLTTFYPPFNFGGDGIGVQRLARAFAARGCEVTVIHDEDAYMTLAGKEPAPSPETAFEVIGLRSKVGIVSNLLTQQLGAPIVHGERIRQILAAKPHDVIWYNNISLVGGPRLLSYGTGIKIYEAHEHWLVCPTHVLWRYNKELCDKRECVRCQISYKRPPQAWRQTGLLESQLHHVDAFIAKSQFSRKKHAEYGFPREMQVIPYFLPEQAALNESTSPIEGPYFLFIGRLEKIKGVQDIIPSFAGEIGPKLLIVGAGEYEAELRELAKPYPRVIFTGRLPPEALSQYYANARALIVPSVCYETFGIILIEAFRNGTPVIARDIGPFGEIVGEGGGLLFKSQAQFEAAVQQLYENPPLRDKLSIEARRAFETNWRENVVMTSYFDLLRGVALAKGDAHVLSVLEGLT
ncbi:hypothetical protein BH11PSE2_BH11PSE2_09120 [soil metagenome]